MTRVKYYKRPEGLLESQKTVTTADEKQLVVFIDTNQNVFSFVDKATGTVTLSGSGKNLNQTKRAVRRKLEELGAQLMGEKRTSVKQALDQANAVVTPSTTVTETAS